MKLLLLFIIWTRVTPCCGKLTWKLLHDGSGVAPGPRRGALLGHDQSSQQLVLFGGDPGPVDDTWTYDIQSKRDSSVGGISNGYFYVALGENVRGVLLSDIWRLDLGTKKWEEILGAKCFLNNSDSSIPKGRIGAAGGIFPGSSTLYVFGGKTVDGLSSELFSFDTRDFTWFPEYGRDHLTFGPKSPNARYLHAGVMVDKHVLVVFGGCLSGQNAGGPCPSGDTWAFSGKTKEWKQLPECPSPRLSASMALLPVVGGEAKAVVFGGNEQSSQVLRTRDVMDDELSVLDVQTLTWQIYRVLGDEKFFFPGQRSAAAMVTGDEGVFMFGGLDVKRQLVRNDLWVLMGNSMSVEDSETVACPQNFLNLITLHGLFTIIGYGFFFVWGAFIARHLQIQRPVWLYLHVTFQTFGLIFSGIGCLFAVVSVQDRHFSFAHAILGAVSMALAVWQPANAIRRPRPAENELEKSLPRKVWEPIHAASGWLAILLGVANIFLGGQAAAAGTLSRTCWCGYLGVVLLFLTAAECRRWYIIRKQCNTYRAYLKSSRDVVEKIRLGHFLDHEKAETTL